MSAPTTGQQLGAFLRAHRELLQPAEVGLLATARRRTPGLRREEVAALSGVGLAWYTWLEQGRVAASRQVLEAVGRALRLDRAGLRHAMRLAGYHEAAESSAPGGLAATVQPVLDSWAASPAALLDRYFDLLAWNAPWSALWGAPQSVPVERRNLMWLMAADRPLRTVLREWEPFAMNIFQHFRAQAGEALGHPRISEVYRHLDQDAPELRHWWACHSVADLTARPLTVDAAGGGPIRLSLSSFRPVDDPSALVLLFTPATEADRAALTALTGHPPRAVRAGPDPVSRS
jgi:transcriptional regulator with XRE-family HTH domain